MKPDGFRTNLGGGVGLFGDTCGAITGAVIAVGAVHGYEAASRPFGGNVENLKDPAVDQSNKVT